VTGYRLSRRAKSATTAILASNEQEFGSAARDRYAALPIQAMRDGTDDPDRHGVATDPAIDAVCRLYHIRHSRSRVATPPGRVGNPRHVLIFELKPDGLVDSLAVVPDLVPGDVAVARIPPRGEASLRIVTQSCGRLASLKPDQPAIARAGC